MAPDNQIQKSSSAAAVADMMHELVVGVNAVEKGKKVVGTAPNRWRVGILRRQPEHSRSSRMVSIQVRMVDLENFYRLGHRSSAGPQDCGTDRVLVEEEDNIRSLPGRVEDHTAVVLVGHSRVAADQVDSDIPWAAVHSHVECCPSAGGLGV